MGRKAHLALLALLRGIYAQSSGCVSLSGSTQCPAFSAASISLSAPVVALFPFLSSVTDTASFDRGLQDYISGPFIQQKYQTLFGCSSFNSQQSTAYYARYTASVLCNAIVQNSASADRCNLQGSAAAPLCADTCAIYTQDEQRIVSSGACGTEGADAQNQLRADFTNCALPAQSLRQNCIPGVQNEPDDCGFQNNLNGLCTYCASSSPNATDSCCVFSQTTTRCQGVNLAIQAASSSTASTTPTSTASSAAQSSQAAQSPARSSGLSTAQIAGIVVGTILGAMILLGILITTCLLMRRRRRQRPSPASSIFNQPNPPRSGPSPVVGAVHDGASIRDPEKTEALPGGRVTRMEAIERDDLKKNHGPGGIFHEAGYQSSEDDSPEERAALGSVPPKRRRFDSEGRPIGFVHASEESSPEDTFSSPDEGTGQSEQLAFFKDYYSSEDIHVGDLVSALWAYQPRAQDEHDLERGDMLKVTGIWDDGWATGVRVRMRAERWRSRSRMQRDSGVSGSSNGDSSPDPAAEVKAFPLVCVCLPQFWAETIEGEAEQEEDGREAT